MMESPIMTKVRASLERHLQTFLLTVVLMAIVWAGNTLQALAGKAPGWDKDIAMLQIAAASAYSRGEAIRDQRATEIRLSAQEVLDTQQQFLINRNAALLDMLLTQQVPPLPKPTTAKR